ncbi:hypothetical protein DFH08DRAFT_96508 [Mycena albidolilacea]|uniref:Uncharacterized protein n=1 Tax=Mycena albidolilacea TaxID=1033008 RepID=A0AAD7E8B5_9AGAR|nr:hypothetical protein DFH08DRAFT_96508 [Mycena albidolilacea]
MSLHSEFLPHCVRPLPRSLHVINTIRVMAKAKAAPLIPRRSPRKHDKTAGTKTAKAKAPAEPELGSVAWSANEGALIWALLDEMQVKDNRLVLFGKNPGTTEGTKGDSKTAVYKRIGSKILPELFENSPNALGKRVKGKAEDLVTAYKKQAKKLQVTGGGLQNDGDDNDEVHEFLECYIPADGPDHDTTSAARNLWGISRVSSSSNPQLII